MYSYTEEQRQPWVGKGKQEAAITVVKAAVIATDVEKGPVVEFEAPGSRKSAPTPLVVQKTAQDTVGGGGVVGVGALRALRNPLFLR
jgi:hypothetical protein